MKNLQEQEVCTMAVCLEVVDRNTMLSNMVQQTDAIARKIVRLQSVAIALQQAAVVVNSIVAVTSAAKQEAICLNTLQAKVNKLLSAHRRFLALQALHEVSILATSIQRRSIDADGNVNTSTTSDVHNGSLLCSKNEPEDDVDVLNGQSASAEHVNFDQNVRSTDEIVLCKKPSQVFGAGHVACSHDNVLNQLEMRTLFSEIKCALDRVDQIIACNVQNGHLATEHGHSSADAGDTGAQVLSVWHQVQAMYGDGCELPDDIAAPNLNRSVTLGTDITSLSRSPVAPGPGKWFDHSECDDYDDNDDEGNAEVSVAEDDRSMVFSEDGSGLDMPFEFDDDLHGQPPDCKYVDEENGHEGARSRPDVEGARPRAATAGQDTSPRRAQLGTDDAARNVSGVARVSREGVEATQARAVRSTSMSMSPSKNPATHTRSTLPRRFTDSVPQPRPDVVVGVEESRNGRGVTKSDGSVAGDWDKLRQNALWGRVGSPLAEQDAHVMDNGNDTQFVSISVSAPRTNKTANIFATHTTYRVVAVRVTGEEVVVERRFNDFLALQTSLRKQYPNLCNTLPALPEKKILGKFKSSFVEKRRVGLEAFVTAVKDNQRQYRFIARFLNRFVADTWHS